MLETLTAEGEFVKIKPSRLVSWILAKYFERGFDRDKSEIIKNHFNSKEYLKSIVRNMDSSDDLSSVLQNTLDKIGNSKRRGRRKVV